MAEENFEQIHQAIIQKEQSISQLSADMMGLIEESNQINSEINTCIQSINETQSSVEESNESRNRFLYDELPKMVDELNLIEVNERNSWNRLQELYNRENGKMKYPLISIGAGVLCGLLFCFL